MNRSRLINDLFSKKIDLNAIENYDLPSDIYTSTKWAVAPLQLQKETLNGTKSLLNDLDLEEWSRHTKHTDPSGYIMPFVKKQFQVELLTRAWCKFYECLSNYELIPHEAVKGQSLSSLHLCEAPGAFVAALNHFLAQNDLLPHWKWCANSLNPNYEGNSPAEMIPDDRLMRYTYDNWYFGVDNTGDITKYYNHLDLVEKLEDEIWLVTADGSVDCSPDPGNQETHVCFLHYCETLTALGVLKRGGSFVLKIFTTFEHATVCLLFLLNVAFGEVSLFKPASSKAGNSEVYVVCLRYKGPHFLKAVWEPLLVPYKNGQFNPNTSMFDLSKIPRDFLAQLTKASAVLMRKQVDRITQNLYHFKRDPQNLHRFKVEVAKRFIRKCGLKALLPTQKLIKAWDAVQSPQSCVKNLSFNNGVVRFSVKELIGGDVSSGIDLKLGERITKVRSSRFCSVHDLDKFRLNRFKIKQNLYQTTEKYLSKNCTVISHDDYNFNTYYEFQKYIFYKIFYSKCDNFVFVRLPFLTNFLAGLLLLLVSSCEDVCLHRSGFLVLCGRDRSFKDLLSRVDGAYKNLSDCFKFPRDVVQIVSPRILSGDFFDFLWNYNRIVLSKI